MLRFEGDRDFSQPPQEVFARLTDPAFLVSCIPDVEKVHEVDADSARLVIRPGLAFVRGSLEVTLRVQERTPTSALVLHLASKGIGSSSTVLASVSLAPAGQGTRAHWSAEVTELGGLLRMVPSGLIRGAAQKVIGDLWDQVAARLSS